MTKITAIYPGTFDPFTLGHADIVGRAARLFGHIIVGVAASPSKTPVFSWAERIDLARTTLSSFAQVEVVGFDNLLVDYAGQRGAQVIIRGLRAVSDFEYEFQLSRMNRKLARDIETLYPTPSEKLDSNSPTLFRELASLRGNLGAFVHRSGQEELIPVLSVLQSCRPTNPNNGQEAHGTDHYR